MRKRVYLFELDSVRKTDEEIIKGQQTLFDEIVTNGNIVVLTYNQLVDSRAFFSLFENDDYAQSILHLFENGAIRLSRYGEVRSLSQYLINSVESEKEFIYSALPIKYSQKHILALMKRCLQYSDLQEIYDYFSDNESGCKSLSEFEKNKKENRLIDLFAETNANGQEQKSSLFDAVDRNEKSKEDIIQEMRDVLKKIYWLLSMVLKLSTMHTIYYDPRKEDEYKDLNLYNILETVVSFENIDDNMWGEAVNVIKTLSAFKAKENNRSHYLRNLYTKYNDDFCKTSLEKIEDRQTYQYAEAIVNLCYNYTCEISICNTSKHYNIVELKENTDQKKTFFHDFLHRLEQDWNGGIDADERYLQEETMQFHSFTQLNKLPEFSAAVRYTKYVQYFSNCVYCKDKNCNCIDCEHEHCKYEDCNYKNISIPRYEYKLQENKKKHKQSVIKAITKKVIFAFICLFTVCLCEYAFNFMEDTFVHFIRIVPFVETLLFLFLTEFITTIISHFCPKLMSLSDALGTLHTLIKDAFMILTRKSSTYANASDAKMLDAESVNQSQNVDFVCSKEIKKYCDLAKEYNKTGLFRDSDVYPLLDLDKDSIKKMISVEEKTNCKFGLLYKSDYNMLVVDPVCSGNDIFPYERIIPSRKDDGVVMVTMYQGRFVLLNQFRHAPRINQYSFPRGYSEDGYSPRENAERELAEELNAKVVNEPVLIGRVISDSGLTSAMAYVYYVEIDLYEKPSAANEGICDIVEVSRKEIQNWIKQGKINDGFTLSAYALFNSRF